MALEGDPGGDWNALTVVAVLGTDRAGASLPKLSGAPGAALAAMAEAPAEARLLASASVLSTYRRAGSMLAAPTAGHEATGAPDETVPACSEAAGRLLEEILVGDMIQLLPEWCALAAAAGVRAPDEWLPALLREMVSHPERASPDVIRPVLGEWGIRLAAQHPDWCGVLGEAVDGGDEEIWHHGTADARIAALARIRGRTPACGRELLAESWSAEASEDRAGLLAALATGLGPEDEDFLEAALDDSLIGVRRAAAGLLARLPDSRYAARATGRAARFVRLEAKKGLLRTKTVVEVDLPGGLDKEMRRDGLSAAKQAGLGQKASLLLEAIAATPLSAWCDAPPADWIAAALKSEWDKPLLWGWTRAAIVQREAAWAAALVEPLAADIRTGDDVARERLSDVLGVLDPAARKALAMRWLWEREKARPELFIAACDRPWDAEFSRRVLRWLVRLFVYGGANAGMLAMTMKVDFDRHMAPELADEAEAAWPAELVESVPALETFIDRLVRTLRFRAQMRKELSR